MPLRLHDLLDRDIDYTDDHQDGIEYVEWILCIVHNTAQGPQLDHHLHGKRNTEGYIPVSQGLLLGLGHGVTLHCEDDGVADDGEERQRGEQRMGGHAALVEGFWGLVLDLIQWLDFRWKGLRDF